MAKRKNIDDAIHGDRADIRGDLFVKPTKKWEDWQADRSEALDNPYYTPSTKALDLDVKPAFGKCYEKHPPLKLPGTERQVHGGSCWTPSVKDADVYIGFDGGMQTSARAWPWTPGDEVRYPVQDMSIPTDPESFKSLVAWTKAQIDAGRKVHCGCIGGHGRTGMFLAALVSEYGEKDAVRYVRKNYCDRAVESSSQVMFLAKHFGVVKAEGAKSYEKNYDGVPVTKSKGGDKSVGLARGVQHYPPLAGNGSIWG